MTTIVVDIQNAKVYSDTLTTSRCDGWEKSGFLSNDKKSWSYQEKDKFKKIFPHDSYVIAGAGCMDTLISFDKSYPDTVPLPTSLTTIMVLMRRYNSICIITYNAEMVEKTLLDIVFNRPTKYKWKRTTKVLDGDWHVIGSGDMYAMGALKAGKNPEEAIKITSSLDSSTGDDVVSFDIP